MQLIPMQLLDHQATDTKLKAYKFYIEILYIDRQALSNKVNKEKRKRKRTKKVRETESERKRKTERKKKKKKERKKER